VKRTLSACAVVLGLVAAGCGSGAGSGTVEPAALAPANTLAYASFEIAPQGPQKEGFDAAFGKLLGADPEQKLGQAFTEGARTGASLDYAADVKPWLGGTISAVVTHVAREHSDYALLVASTDDDKARAAIDKDLAGAHATTRDYRGVSYMALDDGTANGVVDHYLVAGTEAAFKSVVDPAKDGQSLADSEQWKTSVGSRADGKVGLGYVDLKGVLQSLASELPGVQRVAAPLLLGLVQIHPFVATLDATPNSLVVDVSSPGTKPDPRGPGAASSPLIEQMPADAWAALALPKVGQALGRLATALKANPLIGAQYGRVVASVRARTGIDLEKDVLAAVGDVGVFVRGSRPTAVGGAIVVQSPRPATLARTMQKLRRLVPAAVRLRTSGGRAVAAYGAAAIRDAQHPQGHLGDTDLFRKAAASVGERPTFFMAAAPALHLAASSPHHRGDKHFQQALPHLQHLEYLAVGARREGQLDVVRAVLGLR
jgi:hypothetical protein